MSQAPTATNRRFFYWLAPEEFKPLLAALRRRRLRPTPIHGVPCKALNPLVELGVVEPPTWDKVCRRQGSWYRESHRAGQFLVVSAAPLPECLDRLSGVIEPCDFEPPREADDETIEDLLSAEAYRRREPAEWPQIAQREKPYWRNLLERLGSDAEIDELLRVHSANHANFVAPRLFVREGDFVAPYSVARTDRICSACVELFNLLGERYPVKYVMPCPGFVLYAKGARDRYLRVSSGRLARKIALAVSSSAGGDESGAASSDASPRTE